MNSKPVLRKILLQGNEFVENLTSVDSVNGSISLMSWVPARPILFTTMQTGQGSEVDEMLSCFFVDRRLNVHEGSLKAVRVSQIVNCGTLLLFRSLFEFFF